MQQEELLDCMKSASAPDRVTTDAVLNAIRAFPIDSWTTFELAEAMGLPEYPVRTAVSWLLSRNAIRVAGARKRYTRSANAPYWASTYELIERGDDVDCALLNRIFMGC